MNLAGELEDTIANRFSQLDVRRRSKLDRARECALLTILALCPKKTGRKSTNFPNRFLR